MQQDDVKYAAHEGNVEAAQNIIKAGGCLNKQKAV